MNGFVPNTDVVDNIKLGFVTKEQDDDFVSSLAASATKPVKERSMPLILFDKLNSYQKLFSINGPSSAPVPSSGRVT